MSFENTPQIQPHMIDPNWGKELFVPIKQALQTWDDITMAALDAIGNTLHKAAAAVGTKAAEKTMDGLAKGASVAHGAASHMPTGTPHHRRTPSHGVGQLKQLHVTMDMSNAHSGQLASPVTPGHGHSHGHGIGRF